ncbi:MAG: M3 family metallopeptidase [Elusimicrobiota bacterium]
MNSSLKILLSTLIFWPSCAWSQQALVAPTPAQVVPISPLPVGAGAALDNAALVNPAVDLPQTPHELIQRYKTAETQYKAAVDAVVAIPAAERTFANTVKALENADAEFSAITLSGSLLSAVSPDKNLRRAADAVGRRSNRLSLDLSDRDDIYRAYKEYAAKGEKLSGEDKKLLDEILRSYKRNGMELPLAERADLKKIRQRLHDLAQAFDKNLAEYEDGIDLSLEELAGMPESYIQGLPKTQDGKYHVGLDYPSYIPFMQYAQNSELRRQLEFKFNNRAAEKNLPLMEEALPLRQQLAQKLGYKTFAHYTIEERMAKTPEAVMDFLNRLKTLVMGPAKDEQKDLLERARKDNPSAQDVPAWDRNYYAEKMKQERYSYDEEEVRQYFPVQRVIAGTLDVYQELLGLKFNEVPSKNWHEDVKLFEVTDAKSGQKIGHFFLDLFPRKGKYGHAMATEIVVGRELPDGSYRSPVSAMVSNFSKPTPDQPALLTHDEVQTFFHEFGHLMHMTLTQARYTSHSGASVAWDFVETPSQLMENWAWQPEVINRLSGHWKDPSKKLPPELFKKMLAAKNFRSATNTLRQAALATLDMVYHTLLGPVDTTAVMEKVFADIGLPPMSAGNHFQAGFAHIMHGYQAGYYGYLWSLVYAQDAFSRFEREGVMNTSTGRDLREKILARGSSVEESQSLREFLGREPNEDAFLKSLGIEPQQPERPHKTLAEFKNELLEQRGILSSQDAPNSLASAMNAADTRGVSEASGWENPLRRPYASFKNFRNDLLRRTMGVGNPWMMHRSLARKVVDEQGWFLLPLFSGMQNVMEDAVKYLAEIHDTASIERLRKLFEHYTPGAQKKDQDSYDYAGGRATSIYGPQDYIPPKLQGLAAKALLQLMEPQQASEWLRAQFYIALKQPGYVLSSETLHELISCAKKNGQKEIAPVLLQLAQNIRGRFDNYFSRIQYDLKNGHDVSSIGYEDLSKSNLLAAAAFSLASGPQVRSQALDMLVTEYNHADAGEGYADRPHDAILNRVLSLLAELRDPAQRAPIIARLNPERYAEDSGNDYYANVYGLPEISPKLDAETADEIQATLLANREHMWALNYRKVSIRFDDHPHDPVVTISGPNISPKIFYLFEAQGRLWKARFNRLDPRTWLPSFKNPASMSVSEKTQAVLDYAELLSQDVKE